MLKKIFAPFMALLSMLLGFIASAHAALPESIATEIGTFKTDALAAGALIIGAMVAVWGLLKLASKMGWR